MLPPVYIHLTIIQPKSLNLLAIKEPQRVMWNRLQCNTLEEGQWRRSDRLLSQRTYLHCVQVPSFGRFQEPIVHVGVTCGDVLWRNKDMAIISYCPLTKHLEQHKHTFNCFPFTTFSI